jgi:hypothetical protein
VGFTKNAVNDYWDDEWLNEFCCIFYWPFMVMLSTRFHKPSFEHQPLLSLKTNHPIANGAYPGWSRYSLAHTIVIIILSNTIGLYNDTTIY